MQAEGVPPGDQTTRVGIFGEVQRQLADEHATGEDVRGIARQLEQSQREIYATLQSVHQCTATEVAAVCQRAGPQMAAVHDQLRLLATRLPHNSYYKYHDIWRGVIQRLVFVVSLVHYLLTGQLLTREQASEKLGISARVEDGFHLDLNDYLMGILSLTSELARLAVNSVTNNDYTRPLEISAFVSQLSGGFQLLNLKNDALRRKFDSLKYDLKKIEEVVYDISLRGLSKPPPTA